MRSRLLPGLALFGHRAPGVFSHAQDRVEAGSWRRTAYARRILVAAMLAVLSACTAGRHERVVPAAELHVRVLATHDFHGVLRPTTYSWSDGRPVGGIVALKTAMDQFEAACACPTIRVDGGDQMQGTLESNLTFGASVVAAFNRLRLDAAAVGNHELDWGVDTLLTRQREARYAWLAANVFRVDTGQRPEWARPFAMVERAGARVGVVGYATVSTPRTLRPETTRPYEFRAGYAAIRDVLDAVWQQRPDFVILVAHAGGDCTATGCAGELVDLASDIPPGLVHLMVGGHAHDAGEGVVRSTPILRAGAHGRAVGVIDLYRRQGIHTFTMSQQIVYADAVAEDQDMAAWLAPYLLAADARGRERITTLAEPLAASPGGDRRLGDFIADTVRRLAAADVGLHNPGGVRADLPQGDVSYGDLHRVLPFDNAVVRVTLTGHQLRQLVERTGPRFYYSNLRIERGPEAVPSSMTLADGTAIGDDTLYALGTNDFLADGGDGLDMLSVLPREALGVTILDAVVMHLRELPAPVVLPVDTRERQQR